MVDWSSPKEIAADFQIIDKVVHALLGLYIWEYLTTLDFEWQLVTGKRKFNWAMITYFLGRYFQLFGFIGAAIVLDTVTPIDCQAAYKFASFMTFGALTFASVNLGIRTITTLDFNRIAIAAVTLLASGQFALVILAVAGTKGSFVAQAGCSPLGGDKYQAILFVYTTCFNFFLLAATGAQLLVKNCHANNRQVIGTGKFMQVMFNDGLIFFVIALVADIIVVIFMGLNLNKPMNMMFQLPCATFSTIFACRAIKSMLNVSSSASTSTSAGTRTTATSSNNRNISNGNLRGIQSTIQSQPGVHVQMETFTELEERYAEKKEAESVDERDLEANKGAVL